MVPRLVPRSIEPADRPALELVLLAAGCTRRVRPGRRPGPAVGQPLDGGASAELKVFEGGCALHCHSLPVLPALSEALGVVNES